MAEAYDYLSSSNGEILLINCDVAKDRVLAGLVYTAPGIAAKVTICNPKGLQIGFIAIPEDIRRSWQGQVFCSKNDDIEFEFTRY